MRILLTGGSGLLGKAIRARLGARNDLTAVSLSGRDGTVSCDLGDETAVKRLTDDTAFDLILNAAAYSDVDGCERDPEAAWRANALAVRNLARICSTRRAALIHVSTDYVFDGRSTLDYHEEDPVCPVNVYGLSKLAGEHHAAAAGRAAVVRTSWLFGRGPAANFVNAITGRLRAGGPVGVLDDQTDRPTYAPDLAEALERIASRLCSSPEPVFRIWHYCNAGAATRYEMTLKIRELLRLEEVPVGKVDPRAVEKRVAVRPLPRPVLSTERYESEFGVKIRHWHDAMAEYLREGAPCES